MKIAFATDDGQTVSHHYGQAGHYTVLTIRENQVVAREMRSKERCNHGAGHDHGHAHVDAQPTLNVQGGGQPRDHHALMIEAISDCEAAIARGIGRGMYYALPRAGIRPIITDIASIDDAAQAYIDGTIIDHPEKVH